MKTLSKNIKKLYHCQIDLYEDYPCYEFMVEAKGTKGAEKKAIRIGTKDYPEVFRYRSPKMFINEIKTLEDIKNISLIK